MTLLVRVVISNLLVGDNAENVAWISSLQVWTELLYSMKLGITHYECICFVASSITTSTVPC